MALRKFIIEREIPKVGSLDDKQLSDAAAKSNDALCKIGADDIQWMESYVGDDKTFCVYGNHRSFKGCDGASQDC